MERAKVAMKRAQEQIFNASLGVDPAAALHAMQRAQARLDAAAQKGAASHDMIGLVLA